MRQALKQMTFVLISIAMVASTGCTSMQTIHASQDALTEMKIRPGDRLTLNYTSGTTEQIKVSDYDAETISGIAGDGRAVTADYEQVISMDHKEVEALKTAGATVGVVVLGAILIVGAAIGAAASVAGGM